MDDHRFRMIEEIRVLTNVQEFDNLSMRVYRYLDKKEQAGDLDILLTHMGMEIKVKPQQNKLDDKLFPGICTQVYKLE